MNFTCDVCDKVYVTFVDQTRCTMCAKTENGWRKKISQEIRHAIDSGSEINAEGAYLIAKG